MHYHHLKYLGEKTNRVSKWSVEQQEIFVHSGILEIKRLTSEEIRIILPGSITDFFSGSQIRTRLAYEKNKLKGWKDLSVIELEP